AKRGSVAAKEGARPLQNLVGISGGEFARWIKITTPNDRPHVIRVLETAAAILRDEFSPPGGSAEEFLRAELAGGEWRHAADVEDAGNAIGLTLEDIARARHTLGVETQQWRGRPHKWRLPDEEARDACDAA